MHQIPTFWHSEHSGPELSLLKHHLIERKAFCVTLTLIKNGANQRSGVFFNRSNEIIGKKNMERGKNKKGDTWYHYGMMNKTLTKYVLNLASMYWVLQDICFFSGQCQSIKGLRMLKHDTHAYTDLREQQRYVGGMIKKYK